MFIEVAAVFVEVVAVFVEVDGVFVELLAVLDELPEVFIELPGVFLERWLKIIASNAPLEWAWCAWVYGGLGEHNTHIYIAAKAIRLLKQSVDCTTTPSVGRRWGTAKSKARDRATELYRALDYYEDQIHEATWAPDDVLHDNDPFHIFKLFTDEEFPGHGLFEKASFERDGVTYRKFGGGLPYRVDHIAQELVSMAALRDYNEQLLSCSFSASTRSKTRERARLHSQCTRRQLVYQMMLLRASCGNPSGYTTLRHPWLRVAEPLRGRRPRPHALRPARRPALGHGGLAAQPAARRGEAGGPDHEVDGARQLEERWDAAATPVALGEKIVTSEWAKDLKTRTALSEWVEFSYDDCLEGGAITVPTIVKQGVMDFMITRRHVSSLASSLLGAE